MSNPDFIRTLIEPYGPSVPLDALVVELNKLYHSFEAKDYDQVHPEVHQQLPPIWAQMMGIVTSECDKRAWNILDFGCGTGFEATQALEGLGSSRIKFLTCYDPSLDMLTVCRQKIGPRLSNVRFCNTLSEVMYTSEPYDLLMSNSLLHHLPSPGLEIGRLEPVLTKDAWWLLGHEPSKRFYGNPDCRAALREYTKNRTVLKLMNPKACWRRMVRIVGLEDSPAESAAEAAHKARLFTRRPPAFVIDRLVDFNVPHSIEETTVGRGFDFESMDSEIGRQWRLRWVKTYSFMGHVAEARLSEKWRKRCVELATRHPRDGANFCSVWAHI